MVDFEPNPAIPRPPSRLDVSLNLNLSLTLDPSLSLSLSPILTVTLTISPIPRSGSEDGTVKIWDLRAAGPQREYESRGMVNTVVLHPNQGELISGARARRVRNNKTSTADILDITVRNVSVNSFQASGAVFVWKITPVTGTSWSKKSIVHGAVSAQARYASRMTGLVSVDVSNRLQSDGIQTKI